MPYWPSDALPTLPFETFSLTTDVREMIEITQPGGGEAFSLESGDATSVYLVPWDKQRDFIFKFLGFSYADNKSPWRLHRINPVYHPRFPWLTASTVSFSAIGPLKNDDNTGTYVQGVYPSLAGCIKVAQYEWVIATVRFVDRPWTFLDDAQVLSAGSGTAYAGEPYRNTYFTPSPSVEIISAEGLNNILWANNQFSPTSPGNIIPAPFGTLMSKTLLSFRWMWVPNEYVSGPNSLTFTPKWIDSCVGKVNSDTFLGYAPGTLLLQAPTYERFRFPVPTIDGVYGYFGWNIGLNFQFFDPPRGSQDGTLTSGAGTTAGTITLAVAFTNFSVGGTVDVQWAGGGHREGMTVDAYLGLVVAVSGGTGNVLPANSTPIAVYDNAYRGHQLVPYRSNLRWYGAKRQLAGKLYEEAAMSNIFRHVGTF